MTTSRVGIERAVAGLPADEVFDVVDAALSLLRGTEARSYKQWYTAARDLEHILTEGGSEYRVADDLGSLEQRVDGTVREAVIVAQHSAHTAKAGSAADHLKEAWQAAYGRDPQPAVAYSQSIKAVESAAHGVLEPNNAKATLGTMIGTLRGAPNKFQTAIEGPNGGEPTAVLGMLQLLWQGQTSRHGGQTPTRPETQEAAEMAVHLAATLVQWFTAGAVVRRS
ncbi:hypothetical protein [Peterkaempfera bronchialis]|uniref:hypothetical protein n=1 Tax=Peterkaempfera bronchialis TaxID=2126346 RepID=UPI003C2C6582